MAPSTWLTNCADPNTWLNQQLEKVVDYKVLLFITRWRSWSCLVTKPYGIQTQQLLQKKEESWSLTSLQSSPIWKARGQKSIPVYDLITNLRKMLAAKFFSSSHNEDHETPCSQNPMVYKHNNFFKRKMNLGRWLHYKVHQYGRPGGRRASSAEYPYERIV